MDLSLKNRTENSINISVTTDSPIGNGIGSTTGITVTELDIIVTEESTYNDSTISAQIADNINGKLKEMPREDVF